MHDWNRVPASCIAAEKPPFLFSLAHTANAEWKADSFRRGLALSRQACVQKESCALSWYRGLVRLPIFNAGMFWKALFRAGAFLGFCKAEV